MTAPPPADHPPAAHPPAARPPAARPPGARPPAALAFPLCTARLALRPFEMADVEAAHRVYGDPEVMRYVAHGEPWSRTETEQALQGYRAHQAAHGYAFWAVIERESGELIGDAGLERTAHGVELGYTLARSCWGRCLATEAARAVVEAAVGPLGLVRPSAGLVALVDPRHPASAAVLEKLGFALGPTVTAFGRPHRRFTLGS